LQHVRDTEPYLKAKLDELRSLPIVGDVRGAGFFWALELVADDEGSRLDADQREALLRAFMPGRLLQAGVIARPDDRGDSVLHLAPTLTSDRAVLDDLVGRVADVLTDSGEFLAKLGNGGAQA
jgi:adenosylmethionine-8-amino-7-oxononanoate aminotransferase